MKNETQTCIGCKSIYEIDEENPMIQAARDSKAGISRYGVASIECIATFLSILAKEQEWFGYPPAHRLLIDTYSIQHPPNLQHQLKLNIERRFIDASIQSVYIHLIALYCALEKKIDLLAIANIMNQILKNITKDKFIFHALTPPQSLGQIKADYILKELENKITIEQYTNLMFDWAKQSWLAWKDQHKLIENLYQKYK